MELHLTALTQMPQAILFDWDNTIVHSAGVIHPIMEAIKKKFPVDESKINEKVYVGHHSLRVLFPMLFGEKWQDAAKIYYEEYSKIHLQHVQLIEGAKSFLELAEQLSIPCSIVSNKNGAMLRKEVEALGLNRHFFNVIGSTDTEKDKPDSSLALVGLEGIDCDPSNVWFIGDSFIDVECAHNSGCIPILFGHNDDVIEVIRSKNAGPYYKIMGYAELIQQFNSILQLNS